MSLPDPNAFLPEVLSSWRLTPKAHPQFRSRVWSRLESLRRETWAGYVRAHLASWSVIALAFAITAGWAGHAMGEARLEARREAMIVSYLVDLDPRVQARLRP